MVIAIIGTAGSGKSYLLDRMLARDPNRPQVLIALRGDPALRNCGKWPAYLPQRPIVRARLSPRERVLIDMSLLLPEEAQESLEVLLRAVVEQGGGVVAIDEAHLFLTNPRREIIRLIRGSRHFGLKVYLSTQRWVDLHPHIRAVVRHIFILRTVSGRDLHALAGEPGLDVARIPRLSLGEYLYVRR